MSGPMLLFGPETDEDTYRSILRVLVEFYVQLRITQGDFTGRVVSVDDQIIRLKIDGEDEVMGVEWIDVITITVL
jgi:hypothetical protein